MKKPQIGDIVTYFTTPSDNFKIPLKVRNEYRAEIVNVNVDDEGVIHLDSNVDLIIIFPAQGPIKMPEMKIFNCSQGALPGQWCFDK